MSALQNFLRQSKGKPEIIPLVMIVGGALCGAVFVGTHQAKAPDVIWNHKGNPHPWQDIKEGEQVKLYSPNQKYNNRWDRTKW